jgi:ribosomal protein S21
MSRISLGRDSGVVHIEPWDSPESVLKKFKKSCTAAGIPHELSKRRFFLPSSERRRLKSKRNAQQRARAARRLLENRPDADWKPNPGPRA